MLRLDPLAPATPRLPHRRLGMLTQFAVSIALHGGVGVVATVVGTMLATGIDMHRHERAAGHKEPAVRRLVFLAPQLPNIGEGGGGGGNRQPGETRRAQGVGADPIALRIRKPPPKAPNPTADENIPLPSSIALDAKPLAAGIFDHIGLAVDGTSLGTSTGHGSGGGVGTGVGTGMGSGIGPGLGPGMGGGTGGGVSRPGGAVSAPRLIKNVQPHYTDKALRDGIQGTVVMEAIVASDGRADHIRVVKSLDRGLDEEAVAAVAQWRFEPGRLAGEPVDVLVTIMLDFWIR